MRIGTASIARSKTATTEAWFWQAIEAFVIRARTTSLDTRSRGRPGNVTLARTNWRSDAVHRTYEGHFGGGRSRGPPYRHRFAARFLSRDQSAVSRGCAGQRHNMVAYQIQDRTHCRTAC